MSLSIKIAIQGLMILLVTVNVAAKEWRGVVPLESTRADVERLLGKENELGRYQFENERAYVHYSQGPCQGAYQNLRENRCECLVPKDVVLSVLVTLEDIRKFSTLKVDKNRFEKQLVRPGSPAYDYSNIADGVVYRVNDAEDEIISIEYLPSAKSCQNVINRIKHKPINVWRNLLPLHSTRSDVERLFGFPKTSIASDHIYKFEKEAVSFRYAEGNCSARDFGWNVPVNTILEIRVTPLITVLLGELELNLKNYERVESAHPENLFYYTSLEDGVTIQTRLLDGCERVVGIKYGPSRKDLELACPPVDR